VHIDAALATRLVCSQFPQWADLPISGVQLDGWDNRTFRLGTDMTVRLPSAAAYAGQVAKEHLWLPRLAPRLPLPIPFPLAVGVPGDGYPWNWSVYRWLEGETAETAPVANLEGFATTLAHFLTTLQGIDPTDGPPAGEHNFFRGGSLTTYDQQTRDAIAVLDHRIDTATVTTVWQAALASRWRSSSVWFHGDVSAANLLVVNGLLSAVIDFGSSGVGDPACDMVIAWTLLSGASREAFRDALAVDDATWARGRGWALWKSLITLAEHLQTNPVLAARAERTLHAVLADHQGSP
jgi:aminoglycoside phosphotransferase (APT) family kinase protein